MQQRSFAMRTAIKGRASPRSSINGPQAERQAMFDTMNWRTTIRGLAIQLVLVYTVIYHIRKADYMEIKDRLYVRVITAANVQILRSQCTRWLEKFSF
jgi:hypothetical protein